MLERAELWVRVKHRKRNSVVGVLGRGRTVNALRKRQMIQNLVSVIHYHLVDLHMVFAIVVAKKGPLTRNQIYL